MPSCYSDAKFVAMMQNSTRMQSFGYPCIAMTTQSAEDAGLQCGVVETVLIVLCCIATAMEIATTMQDCCDGASLLKGC